MTDMGPGTALLLGSPALRPGGIGYPLPTQRSVSGAGKCTPPPAMVDSGLGGLSPKVLPLTARRRGSQTVASCPPGNPSAGTTVWLVGPTGGREAPPPSGRPLPRTPRPAGGVWSAGTTAGRGKRPWPWPASRSPAARWAPRRTPEGVKVGVVSPGGRPPSRGSPLAPPPGTAPAAFRPSVGKPREVGPRIGCPPAAQVVWGPVDCL